jgi:quinolinate synthase
LKLKNFPQKKMSENIIITEETTLDAVAPEASVETMNRLKSDMRFMVNMHERQLERVADLIEQMAQRIIALEERVTELDNNVRFPDTSLSEEIPGYRP